MKDVSNEVYFRMISTDVVTSMAYYSLPSLVHVHFEQQQDELVPNIVEVFQLLVPNSYHEHKHDRFEINDHLYVYDHPKYILIQ